MERLNSRDDVTGIQGLASPGIESRCTYISVQTSDDPTYTNPPVTAQRISASLDYPIFSTFTRIRRQFALDIPLPLN